MADRELPSADEAERQAITSRDAASAVFTSRTSLEARVALAQVDATLALVARMREGVPVKNEADGYPILVRQG